MQLISYGLCERHSLEMEKFLDEEGLSHLIHSDLTNIKLEALGNVTDNPLDFDPLLYSTQLLIYTAYNVVPAIDDSGATTCPACELYKINWIKASVLHSKGIAEHLGLMVPLL